MTDQRKWHESEVEMVEQMLRSSAYTFLMDTYLREHAARLTSALARDDTDWEQVQRIRGELQGLARFAPETIRKKYPPQSDKP